MSTSTEKRQRMDQGFGFNNHVNDAKDRANAEFVAQFGQENFDKNIAPYLESGIMALDPSKNTFAMAWVVLVTAYVNEDRE